MPPPPVKAKGNTFKFQNLDALAHKIKSLEPSASISVNSGLSTNLKGSKKVKLAQSQLQGKIQATDMGIKQAKSTSNKDKVSLEQMKQISRGSKDKKKNEISKREIAEQSKLHLSQVKQ